MDKSKYFTVGEFASMFGISKQTLFYYERNKIFAPCFVDENGYRYYSMAQYFTFEIIFTMRKLNLPLQDIAKYVKNRNLESLESLYIQRQDCFKKQISILQQNIDNLDLKIRRLEKTKRLFLDKITLKYCAEEYLVCSNFKDNEISMKEQIQEIAKHNLPFASSPIFYEYLFGFILSKDNLLSQSHVNIDKIYTKVTNPDIFENTIVRPEGLYAIIFTTKSYHEAYKPALQKLMNFIERNNLSIVGDAYITHLRNYWSTNKPEEYITEIAIQVEYID